MIYLGRMSLLKDSEKVEIAGIPQAEAQVHKQQRAILTRQHLLSAARTVFARDGFEHARIEDIAARAGKSRGAFYANFEDKEDVFFAIFEDDLAKSCESLLSVLRKAATPQERIAALAQYLGELCCDDQRSLLYLEFKMYALRHPHERERLAALHTSMMNRGSFPEIYELLKGLGTHTDEYDQTACFAMGAVVDGLSLNRLFDPGRLTECQITKFLELCLHSSMRLPDVC